MACTVQVAEDRDSNLVHLLSEVHNGKSSNTTMFVQTKDGVQSASTGVQFLKGDVRHRFTGKYNGTKEQYIRATHSSGYNGVYKRRTLEKIGVQNLRKGFGAAVSVATLGAVVLSGAQVFHLWNKFSADGILTQEELVRMGVEMAEFDNIPSAMREIHTAITEDGTDLLNVAEDPGNLDRIVNGAMDGSEPVAGFGGEEISGFGDFLVRSLSNQGMSKKELYVGIAIDAIIAIPGPDNITPWAST